MIPDWLVRVRSLVQAGPPEELCSWAYLSMKALLLLEERLVFLEISTYKELLMGGYSCHLVWGGGRRGLFMADPKLLILLRESRAVCVGGRCERVLRSDLTTNKGDLISDKRKGIVCSWLSGRQGPEQLQTLQVKKD